ncbi:hypothetical protein [Bacillus mycoides]|nr:hypothetical protein [Bacillus mycoides]
MKKLKIALLTTMSIGVICVGVSQANFKELGMSKKASVILIQYEHGKGI